MNAIVRTVHVTACAANVAAWMMWHNSISWLFLFVSLCQWMMTELLIASDRCSNACMSEPATNDVNREGGTECANAGSIHAEVGHLTNDEQKSK